MVLKYKDKEILTLEDIQRLTIKDLRNILKSNSEKCRRNEGGPGSESVCIAYDRRGRSIIPSKLLKTVVKTVAISNMTKQ